MDDARKPVTILFTDIVGSTTHAEQLDPEEWKEIVNGAHRRVSEAVARYEGTVAQLLGDGVLAFFGAPQAHEDDPARAVRAGLEIQRAISDYAHELRGILQTFQMRAGINTGEVILGAVGSAEHSEYLAVGDAVNVAARLQSAAQPGTVLISEATARLVQSRFDLRDLGEISVKGKTQPVHIFEVGEARAKFSTGRGIDGLVSSLVGRDREAAQVRAALDNLRAGQGQILFVLGEAGIGKSRLIEEARLAQDVSPITNAQMDVGQAGTHPVLRFIEGRALSYGQSLAFWMITQLLQNDLGIADDEPEIRIKLALRRRVTHLFGEKSDEILPYLGHLLGVYLDAQAAERVKSLDAETLKRQVLISLADYFFKLAQGQPTVLVFEDLHWADPSSLDALERLLRVTERAPLMIAVLMRAETDKPAWRLRDLAAREYRRRYHEIELGPLSSADTDQLIGNLLSISDLPDALRQLILERAEGNPLYLEEIIRALMEQGVFVRDERGEWRVPARVSGPESVISNLQIPTTLQALMLARIDRLQDDVKHTLQLAAVIGRSFLYKLLEAISDAERELDWHVSQLERADLVHEKTRVPELEYVFKHSLTREAAYDSLVREQRQDFHRRVANALEKMFAERQDEFLGLLAYHFDRAGEKEKAIDYLIRAGDRMRLSDAHAEAIQFYERARDLLLEVGDLERAAKTCLKLGLIYHANFEFEKAHAANEQAFSLQSRAQERSTASAALEFPREDFELRCDLGPGAHVDPGRAAYLTEGQIILNLFGGLVEIDDELNVLPHGAKSWQVLDGGTRYLFHLRHDVYWTNGEMVTAHDYEWAWKRNLLLNTQYAAVLLDDVIGASAFRLGKSSDADTVAVRALDPFTLEVRLVRSAAYFLYVMGLPIAFPLPRKTIEEYGDEWWKPAHIVSNGPYRLTEHEFRAEIQKLKFTLDRNPAYFGEFPGNVGRVRRVERPPLSTFREIEQVRGQQFFAGELDFNDGEALNPSTGQPYSNNSGDTLLTSFLVLNPTGGPLADIRVRRALCMALDRERLLNATPGIRQRLGDGGLVPPGMAGHSPGIGYKLDLVMARQLLAEAGYPDGSGFPVLQIALQPGAYLPFSIPPVNELSRQWREGIGIEAEIQPESADSPPHVIWGGWVADYPDPDSFLRVWVQWRPSWGPEWLNPRYVELVEEAAHTTDRARRIALYRQADYYLVVEQALVYPRTYGRREFATQPWVKNITINPLGHFHFKNIVMEPH